MQPDPSPYRPVFSSSVARRLGPYALIACGLALLVGSSLAQPVSLAEVQRIKAEVDVPRWREAAALSRLLRANPPDAATAEQWRLLDAETDPSTGKTPLDQIDHAAVAWRNANARWLRWRVLAQNADARYSFAYAAQLIQMRDSQGGFDDEAILFHLHAKLALTLDGARCTDGAKVSHLQRWYLGQQQARQLEQKAAGLTPAQRSSLMLEAIAIEDMRGERPAMNWLCPRRESESATGTSGSSGSGATTASSSGSSGSRTEEALPRFLSDADWRSQRAALLEQMARDAARQL